MDEGLSLEELVLPRGLGKKPREGQYVCRVTNGGMDKQKGC